MTTSDLRIVKLECLDSPEKIKKDSPIGAKAMTTVIQGRHQFREALSGRDKRIVVIVGPCSVHDPRAALEYAERLVKLADELKDHVLVFMRVYFEKPRTTIGWKGFINDPLLDGSEDINLGLREARKLLLAINELGMPCATEFLDPIVPQYLADLISWCAIGARTTESQTHREMASGLSMPVGFKNSTDGSIQVALDAMSAAAHAHSFLGIDQSGMTAIVRTAGNPDTHLVLRGGRHGPNYEPADLVQVKTALGTATKHGRPLLIDCSHGNSGKDYQRQVSVFNNLVEQINSGESSVLGMMLESNLHEGNQKLTSNMKYGVSVTDACIDWNTTEKLLRNLKRSS